MYAITFDLDIAELKKAYGSSHENAYEKIGRVLRKEGFSWTQGSVYFGDATVDPVTCVLAVQHLAKTYPWFAPAVRDIRMLRIEDNNDLLPAIRAVAPEDPTPSAAPVVEVSTTN